MPRRRRGNSVKWKRFERNSNTSLAADSLPVTKTTTRQIPITPVKVRYRCGRCDSSPCQCFSSQSPFVGRRVFVRKVDTLTKLKSSSTFLPIQHDIGEDDSDDELASYSERNQDRDITEDSDLIVTGRLCPLVKSLLRRQEDAGVTRKSRGSSQSSFKKRSRLRMETAVNEGIENLSLSSSLSPPMMRRKRTATSGRPSTVSSRKKRLAVSPKRPQSASTAMPLRAPLLRHPRSERPDRILSGWS